MLSAIYKEALMQPNLVRAFHSILSIFAFLIGGIIGFATAHAATCANNNTLDSFEACFASMNYGPNVWKMTAENCVGEMESARDKVDQRQNKNSNAFLVRWFNENMKKIKNRYNESDRITCEQFMRFAKQKFPSDASIQNAAARFAGAMQPPKHTPGATEPNERDVVLAIAPYLAAGLNLSGNECDLTRIHGCSVRIGTAEFKLSLEPVRNLSCQAGQDGELECSFTAKMSCGSNDPSGVFCGTYGQPYSYERVRFARDSSGWIALPPRER